MPADSMDMMAMQSQAQVSPIFMIVWLAIYLFYSYCLFILAKKLGEQYAWMAWVPVLSIVLQIRMAKMSLWWILGLFVPFFNIYVIIRMLNDGISKRTGHGGWWTVGLILAGWLFMPVTAFHYETGDETTPRPFMGWKKALLILSALIVPILFAGGIFAAALYPAMNGYQSRSQDMARMANMSDMATMLGAYYSDKEEYPANQASGCMSDKVLDSTYMIRGIPSDPTGDIHPGCDGTDGTYAYRSDKDANGTPYFVIGAKMESEVTGNSSLPISSITPTTTLVKGSGPYYYKVY